MSIPVNSKESNFNQNNVQNSAMSLESEKNFEQDSEEGKEDKKDILDEGKSSEIWKYFKIQDKILPDNLEAKFSICSLCKIPLAYKRQTTSMWRHLKSKHEDVYKTANNTKGEEENILKQSKLEFKKKGLSKSKAIAISAAIGRFLSFDMRPLYLIEGRGFKQMIGLLEPEFIIPDRKTFRNEILPNIYLSFKTKIINEITLTDCFSLTYDAWTSMDQRGFLTVTSHFLDENLNFKNIVLKTMELKESHTGEKISKALINIFIEFGITYQEKQIYSVTDSGDLVIFLSENSKLWWN